MHFCADEAMAITAILASLPCVGPYLKAKFTKWRNRHCSCYDEDNNG